MLDSGAVECFVGMLSRDKFESESTRDSCVVALYGLSLGGLRFKGLAKEAGAEEVLRKVEQVGSERASEKAGQILETMKGRDGEEEVDWEELLNSGEGVLVSSSLMTQWAYCWVMKFGLVTISIMVSIAGPVARHPNYDVILGIQMALARDWEISEAVAEQLVLLQMPTPMLWWMGPRSVSLTVNLVLLETDDIDTIWQHPAMLEVIMWHELEDAMPLERSRPIH
ncbi:U-box domain-containing protein 40 [Camellia lanceoleosa]|uniref:U-box domain-containing protein 40 n=1 Tax=Camellia lanceoleosa TaxID=1840588 RepID=A0ACC0J6U7_9ERIC|nr:U-box domain-containing protein 40 [Camellia lanceoleosa]